MLSTLCNFLYVHIPKTAGNAVQGVLAPYADDQIVALGPHQDGVERFEVRSTEYNTHKHSTLAEYHQAYGAEALDRLFKFTCVRNPWDRAVSYYFSPHRGAVTWDRRAFSHFIESIQPVAHYLNVNGNGNGNGIVLSDALRGIDLVMTYEALQSDFDRACERIGIPTERLPIRNKSSRGGYRDYYDADSRALVGRLFREEIDAFEYTFGG
jgi:hypothetical protein